MSYNFALLGFEGDAAPVVLFESTRASDCVYWHKGYTQGGNWGGYDAIALFEVAPWHAAETVHLSDAPIVTFEPEVDA